MLEMRKLEEDDEAHFAEEYNVWLSDEPLTNDEVCQLMPNKLQRHLLRPMVDNHERQKTNIYALQDSASSTYNGVSANRDSLYRPIAASSVTVFTPPFRGATSKGGQHVNPTR
jgi:hypothetical protein